MIEEQYCDICGRSKSSLLIEDLKNKPRFQVDSDGLLICSACQKRLITKPATQISADNLDEVLRPLVGKTAGAICRTLELPYEPPYQLIIDAASNIAYDQDLFMSAWVFVSLWQNGTTVWRDSEGCTTAIVTPEGNIDIQNH